MKKIKWKDINVGDQFIDGSKVISIHDKYESDCYNVIYKHKFKKFNIILSDTHLLLCDIKYVNKECKKWIIENFGNYKIPTLYDKHVYLDHNGQQVFEHLEVINSDQSQIDNNKFWLTIKALNLLINVFKQKIYCNNNRLISINYVGKKEVFCVETNTHKFETNYLIHHNSVTLRNIIFHCLTHQDKIAIALIDLKYTEFSFFRGMKNVVAVANTVQEAAEIMRLGREVMYKRNQEMSKLGINDIKDFKPQKPTDEVMVAGRKLKDTDKVEIKTVDGETKVITVKELEQYLQ